ncbi:MAG: hypothetical protein RCG15_08870 [Candidatus Rickettsia vulgarisii]
MTDTKDKNNKSENFPQLMNILNTLKDALRNTSITSSSNITSQIQQLLNEYGDNPKAKEILSSLLSAATERDSKVSRNKTYFIEEKNIQAREENQQSLIDIIDKVKLTAFHEKDSTLEEEHKKFKLNMQKYLAAKKHHNDLKKEFLERMENGEEISDEDLKRYAAGLLKTPEELKKDYEEKQALYKHNDEVNKHYDEVSAHKTDLEQRKNKLEEEIKLEEAKPPSAQSQGLSEKKASLQNCNKQLAEIAPIHARAAVCKQESNTEIEKARKEEVENKELRGNLLKAAAKTQDKGKENILKLFAVLDDQENADKNNGVMKNPQQYQDFLNILASDNDKQSKGLNEQLISSKPQISSDLKKQTASIVDNMKQKLSNGSPKHNNIPHNKKIDDPAKSQSK